MGQPNGLRTELVSSGWRLYLKNNKKIREHRMYISVLICNPAEKLNNNLECVFFFCGNVMLCGNPFHLLSLVDLAIIFGNKSSTAPHSGVNIDLDISICRIGIGKDTEEELGQPTTTPTPIISKWIASHNHFDTNLLPFGPFIPFLSSCMNAVWWSHSKEEWK